MDQIGNSDEQSEQRNGKLATLSLAEVRVSGLDREKEELAKSAIQTSFRSLEILNEEIGLANVEDFQVNVRYWVANDFDEAVREVLAKYKDAESASRYKARREAVQAAAKCMFKRANDALEATIVLAGHIWDGGQQPQDVFWQYYAILHETCHVAIEIARDESEVENSPEETFEWELEAFSRVVLEEHRADFLSDTLCRALQIAKDQEGNVVGFPEALPWMFEGTALQLFKNLCGWVEDRLQGYREHRALLDEIYEEILARMNELFIVLAHMLGSKSRRDDGVESCREVLETSPGFRAYLEDDWDLFTGAFTKKDKSEAISDIKEVVLNALARVGITVEDRDDGSLYVHVNEPWFCEDEEVD